MRIVGYCRVSREEQAEGGQSLAAQEEKVRLYCRLHNHECVAVVADPGYSAKTLDRPGFKRAFELLEGGSAEGLVIAKLDRISRSLADWQQLIERHFGGGGRFKLLSVADSIDTATAAGRMVLNVMMTMAQWERETIVERTTEALGRRRRTGQRTGTVPYGKRLVPIAEDPAQPRSKSDGPLRLADDPGEFAVLSRILELRRDGASLRGIAATLTCENVPTKTGRSPAWSASTIQSLLRRLDRAQAQAEIDDARQRPAPLGDPGPARPDGL